MVPAGAESPVYAELAEAWAFWRASAQADSRRKSKGVLPLRAKLPEACQSCKGSLRRKGAVFHCTLALTKAKLLTLRVQ